MKKTTLPDLILSIDTNGTAKRTKKIFETIYQRLIFGHWRNDGMTIDHYNSIRLGATAPDGLTEEQKDAWNLYAAWVARAPGERYSVSIDRVLEAARRRQAERSATTIPEMAGR